MSERDILTSTAMLETMWITKKKDLIDLVSPFILWAIARTTTQGETVNLYKILDDVRTSFGYKDMPVSIIEKVLNRKKEYFKKSNNKFMLIKSLDEEAQKMEQRKAECNEKIEKVGEALANFLNEKYGITKSKEEAFEYLQKFFSRYGLVVGTDRLVEEQISRKEQQIEYCIAQFILDNQEANNTIYSSLIDLVKGYYLQMAIYLQAENGNILSESYSKVKFFYDTPFLLKLLGYKSEEDKTSSNELHQVIQTQNGKTFYFPQTEEEINRILYTYQKRIGEKSYITLEGLDEKNYKSDDVERLIVNWRSTLEVSYNIGFHEIPDYRRNKDGSIDCNQIIEENTVRDVIKSSGRKYTDEQINADLDSARSIHVLRNGKAGRDIGQSIAVFVTTNTYFSKVYNKFYRENIDNTAFNPIITDSELSAITWVKCGQVSNLPEKQLLNNAYMAMQPTPELIVKLKSTLLKLQEEGKISEEYAVVLRTDRYLKNELYSKSFEHDWNNSSLLEKDILESEEFLRKKYTEELANEHRKDEDQSKINQLKKDRKAARDYSDKKVKIARTIGDIFVALVLIFIMCLSLTELLRQYKNITISSGCLILIFVTLMGIYDTLVNKKWFLHKKVVVLSQKLGDVIYDKKMKEYRRLHSD